MIQHGVPALLSDRQGVAPPFAGPSKGGRAITQFVRLCWSGQPPGKAEGALGWLTLTHTFGFIASEGFSWSWQLDGIEQVPDIMAGQEAERSCNQNTHCNSLRHALSSPPSTRLVPSSKAPMAS